MAIQVWILLLFALLLGAVLGAGVVVRNSRIEINKIRLQRDNLTADMLDYQHGLRDQLLEQMSMCTESVRTLYTIRQEDATRYTKAMNASLQLVSEVLVAVSNCEATLKQHQAALPGVSAELKAIRLLCDEMRSIMNRVTFDELSRIVATLTEAERKVIDSYQQIADREKARADQLDTLGNNHV